MSDKRILLVRIIAIYLIVLSIAILIFFSFTLLIYMQRSPDFSAARNETPKLVRVIMPAVGGMAFALWCFITGIGLLKKRNWSRYSLNVLSIFFLLLGSIPFAVCIKSGTLPLPLIPFFIILIIIPVMSLVFVNRHRVRVLFRSKEARINRPMGITLLAWLNLLGACSLVYIFAAPETNGAIYGVLIPRLYTFLYSITTSIASLYIAIGFFKLYKSSWYVYLVFNTFQISAAIGNMIGLSDAEMREQMSSSISPAHMSSVIKGARIGQIVTIAVGIMLLLYVISRRRYFLQRKIATSRVCGTRNDRSIVSK